MTHQREPIQLDQNRIPLFKEIDLERHKQDQKFGANRTHSPAEWLMILGEEVGEANQAALEVHFGGYEGADPAKYRKELIQVAAVAVAMIESFDQQRESKRLKKIAQDWFDSGTKLPPGEPPVAPQSRFG